MWHLFIMRSKDEVDDLDKCSNSLNCSHGIILMGTAANCLLNCKSSGLWRVTFYTKSLRGLLKVTLTYAILTPQSSGL